MSLLCKWICFNLLVYLCEMIGCFFFLRCRGHFKWPLCTVSKPHVDTLLHLQPSPLLYWCKHNVQVEFFSVLGKIWWKYSLTLNSFKMCLSTFSASKIFSLILKMLTSFQYLDDLSNISVFYVYTNKWYVSFILLFVRRLCVLTFSHNFGVSLCWTTAASH